MDMALFSPRDDKSQRKTVLKAPTEYEQHTWVVTAKPRLNCDAEARLWFDVSALQGEGEGGRGGGRFSPYPGKLLRPPQSLFQPEELMNEITAWPQLGTVSKKATKSS